MNTALLRKSTNIAFFELWHWLLVVVLIRDFHCTTLVVVVYFPNCNRHTADKYIFRGVQFVAIPSELYSCDV